MRSFLSEIEVDAELQGEFEGKTFSIVASQGRIVIDMPNLFSCTRMIRNRPGRGRLRSDLARLNSLLDQLQNTVEVHINGVCVASTGFDIHSPLESLVGLKQFKLHAFAIFRSAMLRS